MVSSTAAMLVVMGMLMVSNESSSAFGVSREVVPGLSLRLRGGSLVKERQRPSLVTLADQLAPEEEKPDLRRNPSRLILEDLKGNTTSAKPTMFKIDGKEVTEEEYNSRISKVAQRALDPWISQSDRGGFKEGDVLVPDHISSVPEAVAAVAHDGTVYIRKGFYKWDGVLVVQKHMHIRGEPNPDEGEGGGAGRPTLEGRWLLGERSSGSFKHVNCIARFDNKAAGGEAQQGGPEQL
eukprot:CAMPEP_0177709526 /NCGR_PEP_ID=MMETSP0484_2-20121128/10851_1 /TAXON_ID=354590 /ORGANISM="Rhodomonas lens, Strain RHODO" /LENGTH=236 /DNA_ID=CAMNT_0019221151 /DNA_START=13 /DNA_END=723 /DNA_ORIENTATION=+